MESAAQPTGADTPPAPTRARLSRALLAYFVGVVLVVTLAPFRFAVPGRFHVFSVGEPFDLAANVLLFVPLGFLYPLTRPHRRWTLVAQAAGLGLLLSAAIETAQLFEPGRYASLVDLLANGAGALAGAALQHAVSRRIRLGAGAVGRLSLELPLMGLVYLLVPLLWLGSLAAREQPLRLAPLLLVGLFGGTLLAGIWRHRFGPARPLGAAAVAAGWMALGVFPALVFHPRLALPVLATVALAAAWEAGHPDAAAADRRFEARTLRRAAPAFGAYLLAMVLAPLASGTGAWTGWLGFAGRSASLGTAEQLHLLESLAALTVLGYLLAEARSRRELPFRALGLRLALGCAAAAGAVEGVRGFQPAWGASLAQLGVLVGAGLLGGWIFHLQRDHVRALGAARAGAAEGRPAAGVAATLAAVSAAAVLGACAVAPRAGGVGALRVEEHTPWGAAFTGAGADGVFALHRVGSGVVRVSGAGRAARPYLPASTFKVPNSLIALELGVVEDERARFPMTWAPTEIPSWNREHTFASALQNSVVPVYQIVARRVGEARYREWLERLGYGNRDPGGGIDHFWLDGGLRTSALDQVDFLSRLAAGSLPVSERSRRIVRRMLVQEESACYTLYAKTGLVGVAARREVAPEERVGWYVGWVESDTAAWAFALNLDVRRPEDAAKRATIAKELLARSGVLPAEGCGR